MKAQRNGDELCCCYPFIYETSSLCDFEVVTDELCGHIGAAFSLLPDDMPDIAADLDRVQPLAFHVNGSIRGQLAIEEADLAWLQQRLVHYRQEVDERLRSFVLPRGTPPIPQLHMARSAAKKAIRLMVRLEQEGREIPMVLPRMCNLMCNFFFTLTLVINKRRGLDETPFVSKSYSRGARS
jgi:cob(I)alamin adenosyltransferase